MASSQVGQQIHRTRYLGPVRRVRGQPAPAVQQLVSWRQKINNAFTGVTAWTERGLAIAVCLGSLALVHQYLSCMRFILLNTMFVYFRLLFGVLYPGYASYKALKTRNGREHVKWMMYWVVFAFFTAGETVADVILSW